MPNSKRRTVPRKSVDLGQSDSERPQFISGEGTALRAVPCSLDIFAADRADIKPGVEVWIAAQRLNRLAQVL